MKKHEKILKEHGIIVGELYRPKKRINVYYNNSFIFFKKNKREFTTIHKEVFTILDIKSYNNLPSFETTTVDIKIFCMNQILYVAVEDLGQDIVKYTIDTFFILFERVY